MRERKYFESDIEHYRWCIQVLDLLFDAKDHCDSIIERQPLSVMTLKRSVTLELCETFLHCISVHATKKDKKEDVVALKIEEFFRSEDTTRILQRWETVIASAGEQIKLLLQNLSPSLSGVSLARALRMLGLNNIAAGRQSKLFDAKAAESCLNGAVRVSIEQQDYSSIPVCSEELFRLLPLNDTASLLSLSLLQSCGNALYLMATCKQQLGLASKPISYFSDPENSGMDYLPSEKFRTSMYLSTLPSWQKCLLPVPSLEILQDIPKGFRVILLCMSSDRNHVYTGSISRFADGTKNRAHSEELDIKTSIHPIDYEWLVKNVTALELKSGQLEIDETQATSITQLAEFFKSILGPIPEGEPDSAKAAERPEKKKGTAKEEVNVERHCIICSDEHFESLPFEAIFRDYNYTTISRDFGLTYAMQRHRQDPSKKKEKEKVEQTDTSLISFQSIEAFKIFNKTVDTGITDKMTFGKQAAAMRILYGAVA
ncbi:hypothetical protein BC829DRAFT_46651 [Chytridium lagenaria]|nr:hypothetical protein BC829DRAFT_46651 [Chytridium lagenaria]